MRLVRWAHETGGDNARSQVGVRTRKGLATRRTPVGRVPAGRRYKRQCRKGLESTESIGRLSRNKNEQIFVVKLRRHEREAGTNYNRNDSQISELEP